MKHQPHARKIRQLRSMAAQCRQLLNAGYALTADPVVALTKKIRALALDLRAVLSPVALKRALGATAVVLGLATAQQASAQTFAPPVTNPLGLDSTYYVAYPTFADLDGDGDFDMLVGEYYGVMQYFENLGSATSPIFASPQANPFGLDSAYQQAIPEFADLDGDGDMDLLVGSYYGSLYYFENTGTASNPQFAAPQNEPFGLDSAFYVAAPAIADLDGDGDLDVLIGEYPGNMQYYENTGTATNPQFAAPQLNPFGLVSVQTFAFPEFVDLDGDGDFDLMVGEDEGQMLYFVNAGTTTSPQFAGAQTNPFGLTSTYYQAACAFADLDGDSDLDLMVGEYYGALQYFENLSAPPIGIAEAAPVQFELSPNPTTDLLTVRSNEQISQLEILNLLGETVVMAPRGETAISLGDLPAGTYIARVTDANGNVASQKIQKQ